MDNADPVDYVVSWRREPVMAHEWLGKASVMLTAAAIVGVGGMASPATAATGTSVHIEAITHFDPEIQNTFTSNIAGCEAGTVQDGRAAFPPSRGLGVFAGKKVFTCNEGGGFTLQLSARFPVGPGSVGQWAVVDSSGQLAGLTGSGSLLGFAEDDVITDVYDGTIRL
jgi:hypothetical protein